MLGPHQLLRVGYSDHLSFLSSTVGNRADPCDPGPSSSDLVLTHIPPVFSTWHRTPIPVEGVLGAAGRSSEVPNSLVLSFLGQLKRSETRPLSWGCPGY